MLEVLYLQFPFESGAVVCDLFDIYQFTRTIHAGVAGAPTSVMLLEPAKWVSGPSSVVSTIGAQEHVAIISHESLSAANQEVHDRHQRAADNDSEEIKAELWSDEDQREQEKRSILADGL